MPFVMFNGQVVWGTKIRRAGYHTSRGNNEIGTVGITIPKQIAKAVGWQEGDTIVLKTTENDVIFTKASNNQVLP